MRCPPDVQSGQVLEPRVPATGWSAILKSERERFARRTSHYGPLQPSRVALSTAQCRHSGRCMRHGVCLWPARSGQCQ
jgi:hypothetical protein